MTVRRSSSRCVRSRRRRRSTSAAWRISDEQCAITGTGQPARLAVVGGPAVEAGDHVAAHPARLQVVGVGVEVGQATVVDGFGRPEHCELTPATLIGHTQNCSTSLWCVHARVQRCGAFGRSASHRHAGAVDRPTRSAADVRRRQLRHLPARPGRAVAGGGRAVVQAVLRAGGDTAGGQEEVVRQARGAARCRALPRRRVRRRQDAPAGVVVLSTVPSRRPSPRSAS